MRINAEHDVAVLAKGKYSCLQALEQRTIIERVTSALFVSTIRRLQGNKPGSVIVLDCRARVHVSSNSYLTFVQNLNAVVMAEHIPPHQHCTQESRDSVKNWLQVNCNLKHVFLMDAYAAKTSVHGNNMLTRVLKYLGLSQACPVRVCLLDCGLHEASRSRVTLGLLKVPAPVSVGLVAKKQIGDGLYVYPVEFLKADSGIASAVAELNVRYVLNLTRTPTGLQGAFDLGAVRLPLRNVKECTSYMIAAIEYLLSLPDGANVIIIDNHLNKIASEVLVGLLILKANYSYESALGIVRARLTPPEFDSFAKAAFMILAELEGTTRSRMELAFAQLAGRFDPEFDLKFTTKMNLAESWAVVQKMLTGKSVVEYTPILQLISKMCNNILLHPNDPKYRQVKLSNPRLQKVFRLMPELGPMILKAGGWIINDECQAYEFKSNPQLLRDLLIYVNSAS